MGAASRATILHADLDAFYASVEQLLDPSLSQRPIAVGGGVVLAASYEARAFGVGGGMPGWRARQLCPNLTFVPGHFDEYQRLGDRVMSVFDAYTPLVERISIDEAFLEVEGALHLFGSPTDIAVAIRHRVRNEIGLPVSIGVARTKHLAKVASQVAKPDGLVVVTPEREKSFLEHLPVELMWGVGPVTRARLAEAGIHRIGELAAAPNALLDHLLGKAIGGKLASLAVNVDGRRIETSRRSASVGAQAALGRRVATPALVRSTLGYLADRVAGRLRAAGQAGRTVTVKVRFTGLRSVTRSTTLGAPISATLTLTELATELAGVALTDHPGEREITLLAVSVANLVREPALQLELPFDLVENRYRPGTSQGAARSEVDRSMDAIRARFGHNAVRYATAMVGDADRVPEAFRGSPSVILRGVDQRAHDAIPGVPSAPWVPRCGTVPSGHRDVNLHVRAPVTLSPRRARRVNQMPDDDRVMRAWRTHKYGHPIDVLKLDTVPIPDPEAGELRIKVHAIPLNLNDLERITGGNMMVRPELPYSPGMEVMGVVDACGPGTEQWSGRRVVAMPKGAHGGFAEYAVCPAVSTFEIPDSIPLPGAAALYFPFHLAWLGLFDRADLQAGETVLIHAAAGGSGSAAVQLAVNAGAQVFATAGTDEKVQLCRDLGAQVAINYSVTDFSEVVLAQTGNQGVDVVFDNVGEAVMEQSMKCTKYNGRYVMMGFASNKVVADEKWLVPRRIALGNFRLCGVLLAYQAPDAVDFLKTGMGWNFASEALGQQIMGHVIDLVLARKIRPVVGRVVAFEDIPAAMVAIADRETVGRTVVTLEP